MRLFNDIIDLGIYNESALMILNFAVIVHLLLFFVLLSYTLYMATRSEKDVFDSEVKNLKEKIETKKTR